MSAMTLSFFSALAQPETKALVINNLAFPDRFLAIRRHVGSNLVDRHKPLSAGELSWGDGIKDTYRT